MIVQIAVRKVVSHLPGGLGHFADSNSIPQNQPTIFHEILIAAILLKIRLSFVARLFQQCHSFRIDEVLKCDSMICLHRICQTPMNCQCKRLLPFPTAGEISVNSIPFPEKFPFCTDKIVSIEWQDLEPRLRTDDCLEIHFLRWGLCDLLFIKSPNFSARGTASPARLLQRALVILVLGLFGKWVLQRCFRDAAFVGRSESESWEISAGAGTSAISKFSVKSSSNSGIPSLLQFSATPCCSLP